MEIRLLGHLEIIDGDRDITPTSPKLREIVALFVLNSNTVLQKQVLIDKLWGDHPPSTAEATLQTYIYKLRKTRLLREHGPEVMLVTKSGGYQLNLPAQWVDVYAFEYRVRRAEEIVAHDPLGASELLDTALHLWRGPALADVELNEALSAHAESLRERWLHAVELQVEVELSLGRHSALISRLKQLTSVNRFHESMHCQLMVALYRAGRTTEALDVFTAFRAVLIDELGLEPSPKMLEVQRSIISGDATLNSPGEQPCNQSMRGMGAPLQLPPALVCFSGRERELASIERNIHEAAESAGRGRPVVPVAQIAGAAGIGKTELAMEVARRLAGRYPGGQLVANLGGSSDRPRDTADVLATLLESVGFSQGQIPCSTDARMNLFRSWMAVNPTLLVLDDAASREQVLPLIPGSSRCAVLVTARAPIPALQVGAGTILLEPLDLSDAVTVLSVDRTENRGARAERIARICGCVPAELVRAREALLGDDGIEFDEDVELTA